VIPRQAIAFVLRVIGWGWTIGGIVTGAVIVILALLAWHLK